MDQKKLTFANGDTAVINMVSAKLAFKIKNAMVAAAKKQDININEGDLINLFLAIDSDQAFNDALFEGLSSKCIYNDANIIEDTFNSANARENYYEMVKEFLTLNILPFFKSLLSQLKNLGSQSSLNPELKSEQTNSL